MKNELKSYKVTIFESQYTLLSDNREEDVIAVAAHVDTIMKDIAQKSRLQDGQKIAVLTALKVIQEKIDLENSAAESIHLIKNLIQRVDNAMDALAIL